MKRKLLIALGATTSVILLALVLLVSADIPAADVEKRYKLPESKFMDLDGLRVHYTDEGKGEVLVLVHGTAASLHTWNEWVKVLKKSFRVIRMDLPAFGLTGPSVARDYSIAAYVRFLENFFAQLKIKQVNIVGNSLGGQIAWHYAAAHTDDVNKLVLIDSAGLPRAKPIPLPMRLARSSLLGPLARYISPKFLVRKSLKDVYFDDGLVTDELVERYYTMALREGNRQAFIDRAVQMTEDTGEGLERIRLPTLIMWGRHDAWIPVELAESFHKKLGWSQVVIYDNAGHVPHEEIPEQTLVDAVKFLK